MTFDTFHQFENLENTKVKKEIRTNSCASYRQKENRTNQKNFLGSHDVF